MPLEWYCAFRLPGLGQHFGVLDIWTSWCCAAKYMPTQFAARCEGPVGASGGDTQTHDDVIKWKHFPRYWPFVRGIHRSPVNSPHKGQWRGALMFSLICVWINGWVNNRDAGDLRRYRAPYDIIVMHWAKMSSDVLTSIHLGGHLKRCKFNVWCRYPW